MIVLFLLLCSATSLVRSFKEEELDFNCQEVCGTYTDDDILMKNIQGDCNSYDQENKCAAKDIVDPIVKPIGKKATSETTRIVGGEEAKKPIPWMVVLLLNKEVCGGSLINSRYILTAAHCACAGNHRMYCSRAMWEIVEGVPIKPKEDLTEAIDKTFIHIGASKAKSGTDDLYTLIEIFNGGSEGIYKQKMETFFIHEDLATSEEFPNTPDVMLIRLEKAVPNFTPYIKPVCLAKPDAVDFPPCPDISVDKVAEDPTIPGLVEGKAKGGCGLIAGWGGMFGALNGSACSTKPAKEFPSRASVCAQKWKVNGVSTAECQKNKSPGPKDFTKFCKRLMTEINFQAVFKEKASQKWKLGNYNTITELAPIKVLDVKKNKNYTCSTTDMERIKKIAAQNNPKSQNPFNGWCATKVNRKELIKEIGLCSDKCFPAYTQNPLQYTNVNLLTKTECQYFLDNDSSYYKPDMEMCAGKKWMFPEKRLFFYKLKKRKREKKADMKLRREILKNNVSGYDDATTKPTKSKYIFQSEIQDFDGLKEGYPYNWYLGGSDSCQGDSGGPLWRNVKTKAEVRATQLGVVARGKGCAAFNQPGIYTRVKKIYSWIQEKIKSFKETHEELCPVSGSKKK